MKKCTIGGQAVMEGVMMKSPQGIAMAVRREDGSIVKEFTVSYTHLASALPPMTACAGQSGSAGLIRPCLRANRIYNNPFL